jgi:hypothetical protein
MEQWKDIPGFENYMVSDQGRVWSKRNEIVLKFGVNDRGYYRVTMSVSNKRVTYSVHQLVMLAFVGECPEGHEVNHINGVKTDNRLENLEYVTRSENMLHAVNLQLVKSKLPQNKQNKIYKMYNSGKYSMRDLANIFEVSVATIFKVLRRMWNE